LKLKQATTPPSESVIAVIPALPAK